MATLIPLALPVGHWAQPAGPADEPEGLMMTGIQAVYRATAQPAGRPAAPNPLNVAGVQAVHRAALAAAAKLVYDGIPDVDKVHEWGEVHAANHNAIQQCDAAIGLASFSSYDYLAYPVPPTLPNRLQEWMHNLLTEIAPPILPFGGRSGDSVGKVAGGGSGVCGSEGHREGGRGKTEEDGYPEGNPEFPKTLTTGYRFTISSLDLPDSLEDYIRASSVCSSRRASPFISSILPWREPVPPP
ncbi:hypothetical protein BDZ88DRAFT_456361 [Geranomyces variabilis]|nr:hypothetical protein BDZ88DRAFT_456361 [Geranomyces variabilis]